MRACPRLVMVEDTYGADFHRSIIERLESAGVLAPARKPRVERMHAGKCNPKLRRVVTARTGGSECWRCLFVIDLEDHPSPETAARMDVLRHFPGSRYEGRLRVVVVVPRHEAWLCIGLGGDVRGCRSRPEDLIGRIAGSRYEKRMLSALAGGVRIERLLGQPDFRAYIDGLRWLLG